MSKAPRDFGELSRTAFGEESEALAARFLSQRGYRVVARHYRTRHGEIDLIAYDGDTLVFVEVKARRSHAFGEPHWSVDHRKQVRLSRLAFHYLHHHRLREWPCRFDLVLIQADKGRPPVIELIKNAFEVRGESRFP